MAEDLIARYELDVSNLKLQVKELESQFAKLTDAETKSAKAGEEGFKKTAKAAKETSDVAKKFNEEFNNLAQSIGAAFATERIIAFGKECVSAFAEAELNARKLQVAVGVNGGLQKDYEALLELSSSLQETTIFSDDAIQQAETAALQFGLTSDQVKNLIPVIADFASATGQDLGTALDAVLRGVEGSTRGLKLYGVEVDTTKSKGEILNQIISELNGSFKGQAEIIASTTTGQIKKYGNQWDELKENLGSKIVPFLNFFASAIRNTLGFDPTLQFGGAAAREKANEDLKKDGEKNRIYIESYQKAITNLTKSQLEERQKFILNQQKNASEADKKQYQLQLIAVGNALRQRKLLEEQAASKKDDKGTKTNDDAKRSLEELQKITDDANQKLNESVAKSEEEKLNIQRQAAIKKAEELFKGAGGSANLKAVEEFKKAELAINAEYDELIKESKIKSIDSTYANTKAAIKQNADEELQANLSAIDDNSNAQILAAKKAYLEKGNFTKESEKKLQDEITKIQLQAEKDRIENSKKIREAQIEDEKNAAINAAFQKAIIENNGNAEKALSSKTYLDGVVKAEDDANKQKTKSDQTYAKEKNALDQKTTDNAINSAEAESDGWLGRNQAKIDAAYKAASEIMAAYDAVLKSQIKAKEDELTALKESYDAEDEELQNRYDKRLIGAGDFEKQQAIIKQQRIASEKKIQAELNKLKHQEDVANRAKAIFEIILNTSVAVAKLLDTPFLAIMAGIAGAAQLTTILATPLPKYAKGTKYLQRGNNPFGVDTIPIMANEGERIIPTDRNKKYWSIYEAIDSGKWNEYVNQKYIAPALKNQLAEFKKSESASFAENISNSLVFNHGLLAEKIGSEIEWRNRNGIKVKGMDQLIDALNSKTDIRKR